MEKALFVWGADLGEVSLGVCLHAWSGITSSLRQRLRLSTRIEGMLDRAILRWGSESSAVTLHVVVCAWRDSVLRKLLEQSAASPIAIAAAAVVPDAAPIAAAGAEPDAARLTEERCSQTEAACEPSPTAGPGASPNSGEPSGADGVEVVPRSRFCVLL